MDVVFGWMRTAYSASEQAVLSDFRSGGGRLVLVGDHSGIASIEDAAINGMVSALGSTMSLDLTAIDGEPPLRLRPGEFEPARVATGAPL